MGKAPILVSSADLSIIDRGFNKAKGTSSEPGKNEGGQTS